MDAIKQLAEERRRRYEQLSAEDKPKVAVCPACKAATYTKEVCPETGLFHDVANKTIVGGSIMDGKFIRSSELMGAIDRTRVKWAPSRTQLVKCDANALNIFQSFVSQMDWKLQRYGLLYGQYDEKASTVEVHAIYEPEQHGTEYTFALLDDPRIHKVDAIATELGLRRVGAICTHPPRDAEQIVLSSREMLLCAREQSRFGDECVLLTISPSASAEQPGVIECQAWQTSAQCVYLYRMGLLHEPTADAFGGSSTAMSSSGGNVCRGNSSSSSKVSPPAAVAVSAAAAASSRPHPLSVPEEARMVGSTIELEVAQEDRDPQGKQRFITKAPSKLVDTRWFTSYTAVQQFSSDVVKSLFMRISRPGMAPPTFQNLKNYMKDPKRAKESFAEKIADFHVLIFLADVFSIEHDIPILAQIARLRANTEEALNYEAILAEYMH